MMRWYTRDLHASGRLADYILEWCIRPVLVEGRCGGMVWMPPLDCEIAKAFIARHPIEEAKRLLRTVPETQFECVRYG